MIFNNLYIRSMTHNTIDEAIQNLFNLVQNVEDRGDKSYTKYLVNGPIEKLIQKVGEEGVEVVIAAMKQNKDELIYESVDLIYHLSILWAVQNISLENIITEINKRGEKSENKKEGL